MVLQGLISGKKGLFKGLTWREAHPRVEVQHLPEEVQEFWIIQEYCPTGIIVLLQERPDRIDTIAHDHLLLL